MPKVRRSKKHPPEGWELIEPTLEELEQKMREGNHDTVYVGYVFTIDIIPCVIYVSNGYFWIDVYIVNYSVVEL